MSAASYKMTVMISSNSALWLDRSQRGCYCHVKLTQSTAMDRLRVDDYSPPFFLRDSGASETRARVEITPREERRHARRVSPVLGRLIFTSASSQAIFTPPFPLPPLQPRPQGFSLKKWVGTRLPPLYVWVKLLGYILTSRIKLIFGIHGLQEMFFWIEKNFGRQAEFYNQSHRVQRSFVLRNELLI